MKKFSFSLNTLLSLRAQKEQAEAQNYAQALGAFQALQQEIVALKSSLEKHQANQRNKMANGYNSHDAQLDLKAVNYYKEKLQEKNLELRSAEDHLERRAAILSKTRQDKKVIQQYREELEGQYHYQLQCHEQKLIDEMALRGGIQAS